MKIGIITRHAIANYGSFLQTYATQKTFERLGHDATIINYIREDEKEKNIVNTYANSSAFFGKNAFTKFLYKLIQQFNIKNMDKKFKVYREKYLNLTKEVSTDEELKEISNFDILCTGSDQVWGKIGNDDYDKNYFLNFADEGEKCISYAASFGKSELSDNLKNNIVNLTNKYKTILVREDSAVKFLNDNNIKNVNQILDPTLQLSKEEWTEFSCNVDLKKPYYVVYQLHHNKEFEEYVKNIQKTKKVKVYRINPSIYFRLKPGKFIYLPNPKEFLGIIRNADCVLTDSFHGTVFSLIFNKKFVDFLPKITGTRIVSLLNLFGLQNRIINDKNNIEILDEEIDYSMVNKILEEEREKSLNFLKGAINE